MRGLSKTSYKMGANCKRALWLRVNMPEEADERFADPAAPLGTEVGELARDYYPGTVLADMWDADDPDRLAKAAQRTRELMQAGCQCIAEATFITDGGDLCQVDLLRRNGEGWDMVECKSACNVWRDSARSYIRPDYLEDVSFQTWILDSCGVSLNRVLLMHPDSDYRLHGDLDIHGFFSFEDVTEHAFNGATDVAASIDNVRSIMSEKEEPKTKPGGCCCKPKCPYFGHCVPSAARDDSVIWTANLNRKKAIEYIDAGIVTMDDLLVSTPAQRGQRDEKPLSDVVRVQAGGSDYVNVENLRDWLSHLKGKTLYWLDFETCQYPIPRYEGDKPWEQVPTQYSLHITEPTGAVEHREFLAEAGRDPWRDVAEHLVSDIPCGAVTVAYNKTFERDRIKAMADKFPDLRAHLLNLVREDNPYGKHRDPRDLSGLGLVDLIDPFKKGWVYRPAMRGSKSIKLVLPALFPKEPALDYHNLVNHGEGAPDVQNGKMAISAFTALEDMDGATAIATRENLLRYCELDTWAMVAIYRRLVSVADGASFDDPLDVTMPPHHKGKDKLDDVVSAALTQSHLAEIEPLRVTRSRESSR